MKKINIKLPFFSHTISISAFFIIGQFIITLPFINGLNGLTGFIVSAFLGVLLCFLTMNLIPRIITSKHKILKNAILVFVIILSGFTLGRTFICFCNFSTDVLLENASDFVAIILFLLVCFYFSFKRQENVLKFALLSFIYTVVAIAILLFLLFPNFKLQNIDFVNDFNIEEVAKSTITHFINIFLPSFLLIFYNYSFSSKNKAVFLGILIAVLILTVCGLSTVLLFGSYFASSVKYPFISAVSTVSVGKLFSRLDAFFYFFYFFACLFRIVVCVFVIKFCFKRIDKCKILRYHLK